MLILRQRAIVFSVLSVGPNNDVIKGRYIFSVLDSKLDNMCMVWERAIYGGQRASGNKADGWMRVFVRLIQWPERTEEVHGPQGKGSGWARSPSLGHWRSNKEGGSGGVIFGEGKPLHTRKSMEFGLSFISGKWPPPPPTSVHKNETSRH